VRGQQFIHAIAERLASLTQGGEFGSADVRAPFETLANGGLKAVEVTGMDARCLRRLNRGEDIERVCPPASVDAGTVQAKVSKSANGALQIGEN